MTATPRAWSRRTSANSFCTSRCVSEPGGFVEHEHPTAERHGARDLDELPLGQRQVARDGLGRDVLVADLVERTPGHGPHLPPVQEQAAGLCRLAAQEDVLHHAQVRREREVLINRANAPRPGGERIGGLVGSTVEGHGSGVGEFRAREQAHERRFARAVLADERVDAAGLDRQVHAAQGCGGPEGFLHPAHREQRGGGGGDGHGGIERQGGGAALRSG